MKEIFSHTGTAHILAISGLHVGFVFSMALILFRILNFPVRMQAFLTIVVIIIYCLITGGRPPAVRASIMAVMILTGMILVRPVNIWNSLALSAFLVLVLNPMELFGPGFQMSFMAVSGIVYINPRLQKLWRPSNSWLGRGWKAVTVITGAQAAILPLAAYYFNIFPLISFPANLVVVPILGLVVGLGFSACISGLIWIGFAHLFNAANGVVITALLKTLNFLYLLPGSCIEVPSPPIYLIIVYYAGVFILLKMIEDVEIGRSYV
jgi:competence protein ComEC